MRETVVAAIAATGLAAALYWILAADGGGSIDHADERAATHARREPRAGGHRQRQRQRPAPESGGAAAAMRHGPPATVTLCSSAVLGPDRMWRAGAADVVAALVRDVELVFLVEDCTTDEDAKTVTNMVAQVGVAATRCVFCELPESIVHVTRHLSPKVHLESNAGRAATLAKFGNVVLLDDGSEEAKTAGVRRASSLTEAVVAVCASAGL
eukprot:m.202840 g.202840  ORF g.202840 m.202840 type:complete len:211 (-) comp21937_c0_seq1:273-905(-)